MMFSSKCNHSGVSMLEVLIAIVIFAVGLLAIASLQGGLVRSSTEAKARTVATNLAQDKIEELRAFETLLNQTGKVSYESICTDATWADVAAPDCTMGPETISDLNDVYGDAAPALSLDTEFTRTWAVTGQCYGTATECASKLFPDYWEVAVTVTWEDASGETKEVVVQNAIGAIPPTGAVGVVGGLQEPGLPEVDYRLVAATQEITSVPVLETGEGYQETWRVETDTVMGEAVRRIEAIHYDNDPNDEFRAVTSRDEYLAVSCKCSFDTSGSLYGQTPTVATPWTLATENEARAGFTSGLTANPDTDDPFDPTEAEINKEAGVVNASEGESALPLCTRCCLSHHDSDTSYDHDKDTVLEDDNDDDIFDDGNRDTPEILTAYDPFRGNFPTSHAHYNETDLTTPVTSGDYLESCRFIRKDGIFELSRDFYLVELTIVKPDEVSPYGVYAREFLQELLARIQEDYGDGAVDSTTYTPSAPAYPTEVPPMGGPTTGWKQTNAVGFRDPVTQSEIPDLTVQAVYLDYLDPAMRDYILCLQDEDKVNATCEAKYPNLDGDDPADAEDPVNWPTPFSALPFQVLDVSAFVTAEIVGINDGAEPITIANAPDHVDLPDTANSSSKYCFWKVSIRRSNSGLAPGGVAIDPDEFDNPLNLSDDDDLAVDRRLVEVDSTVSDCTTL